MMMPSTQTRAQVQTKISAYLRAANIKTAALETRVLMRYVCNCTDVELIAEPQISVDKNHYQTLKKFAERRCNHTPLNRILKKCEFYGIEFQLNAGVFEPRQDSETIIDNALQHNPNHILELGTGTGALLIALIATLSAQNQNPRGLGIDISRRAIRLARLNAAKLKCTPQARFQHIPWARILTPNTLNTAQFDMIIANPPYITAHERKYLAQNITEHDPKRALDGGHDGLNAYRDILKRLAECRKHLKQTKPITIIFEIGETQAQNIQKICSQYHFPKPKIQKDLRQKPRIMTTKLTK